MAASKVVPKDTRKAEYSAVLLVVSWAVSRVASKGAYSVALRVGAWGNFV